MQRWREVSKGTIIRPILHAAGPADRAALHRRDPLGARGCGCPACSTRSRSSATWTGGSTGTPCTATSTRTWSRSSATVATAARTGRTVVFVEGHAERIKHKSHAIDYVTTPAGRPARAGVGGDPDPVPAGARRAPERGARLVLRRRHAPEHADQAGARPGRRAADRGRHRLGRRAVEAARAPRLRAARLRRRRTARAGGHAGRPGRRGHAHPRQHQHVLRRPQERRAPSGARLPGAARAISPPSATGPRAASRPTAASPTSSSRRRSAARSGVWPRRCSATATAA